MLSVISLFAGALNPALAADAEPQDAFMYFVDAQPVAAAARTKADILIESYGDCATAAYGNITLKRGIYTSADGSQTMYGISDRQLQISASTATGATGDALFGGECGSDGFPQAVPPTEADVPILAEIDDATFAWMQTAYPAYVVVSNDGEAAPLDALLVINH